ncbi:Holliday junction resolvase RecU [Bacillus sp. Bva_UNVM-123]|uniref:Holliday junction resolvase RecU n=1 Tax=Bacillus sp. Bva_UNVM-123 TaxID=2829798 RepID=UPI00391F4EDF
MSKKKNEGKLFEQDVETSCNEQNIFYFRVRDVKLPPDVRMRVKLPQNKFDCLLYYKDHLFPIEMKSTKDKSISLKEHMIKQHQITSLKESTKYNGVIAGFLLNFREPETRTFFIHIDEFIKYKNIAENQLSHTYKSRINESSIPLRICEEIGVEVRSVLKNVRYRHYMNKFIR